MRTRSRNLLDRAERATASHGQDGVLLVAVGNNPEAARLNLPMLSPREAILGGEHFVPRQPPSTTGRSLAKARGSKIVVLGHPSNARDPDADAKEANG